MRAENQKQVVHCMICVSRLASGIGDKRDIGAHYERLFKACRQKYQGENPSGILLIYPQHSVHVIEAPWELITAAIADLQNTDREGGLLVSSRILVFVSNVKRLYSQWSYRVLNLPILSKGESYTTSNPVERTVAASLEMLYKLGTHLARLPQHKLKATLDGLPDQVPQLLIQQDVLEYLVNCSSLSTPLEFTQLYSKPAQVALDSELVWPLPVRLFPYND
eukprot:Em0020g120a